MKKCGFICLLILSMTVFAQGKDSIQQMQQRISLLEQALAPHTAKDTAQAWAQAVIQRNGAVQFMLLCPSQQQAHQKTLVALNWITGTSSPRAINYTLNDIGQSDNSYNFDIIYTMNLSGQIYNIKDKLQIIQTKNKTWCIDQFKWLSPDAANPHGNS